MEYIIKKILLFIILLSGIRSSGQNIQRSINNTDSIEIHIKEIRKEYGMINNSIGKYRVVQEDIEDQSTEGGESMKFYDGKALRKALFTFYGETGKSISEWYFQNGEIIFLYKRLYRYEAPISSGNTKVKSKEENRFYFQNKKLIRWIGNNGKIKKTGLYSEKQKEILDELRNINTPEN